MANRPRAAGLLCARCGRRRRVACGWTVGATVRKHYWRHHRHVMESKAR
jgi:hypothetical protein